MNIDIKETEIFKKAVKKEKINPEDLKILKDKLRENPEKGDLIPNSGGLRKIRMSIENSSKRDGARVIYLYLSLRGRIYLMTAYKKGKQENISDRELKQLKQFGKLLKIEDK